MLIKSKSSDRVINISWDELNQGCRFLNCPRVLKAICKKQASNNFEAIICDDLVNYINKVRGVVDHESK